MDKPSAELLSVEDLIAQQNQWAMGFLKQQEEINNVKILFAAETGSRGYGTDMDDSDFDIKGFFISPQAAYVSVMGAPKAIRFYHQPVIIAGKEYELDLEVI